MSRPEKPDTRDAQLADMDRRLRALEVGGRAEHTTMQGGLFRVRDVGGDLRAAMGDLDLDESTWGFEVTAGGVFRVRDRDGNIRGILGDIDDDDNFYALVLYPGGQVQVRDEDGVAQAAMGDIGVDEDTLLPIHGFQVLNGGLVRVFGGGAMQVFDGGSIQVIGDGFLQVIGAVMTAGPDGSGPFPVWIGDLTDRAIDADGKTGVVLAVGDGSHPYFWTDEDGFHEPWFPVPVVDFSAEKTTSSGSFDALWSGKVFSVYHGGVRAIVNYYADAGTTGEVRISAGAGSTDAVTIADGVSGTAEFSWLHDIALGAGPFAFDVEARVTGGGGQIHILTPDMAMVDPKVCTATGLP